MQPAHTYNKAHHDKSKSSNFDIKESATQGHTQVGPKNMNDQSFHYQQMPHQSFQYMRASSPVQNDSRRSFPAFVQKNPSNNMLHQGPKMEAKIPSPNGTNNFSEFV